MVERSDEEILEEVYNYEKKHEFMPCKFLRPHCGNEESLYYDMRCEKELGDVCNFYFPVDFVQLKMIYGTKSREIEGYARMFKKY